MKMVLQMCMLAPRWSNGATDPVGWGINMGGFDSREMRQVVCFVSQVTDSRR